MIRQIILIAALGLGSLEAWEVQSISGRDHVKVSDVASFYGLGKQSTPSLKTLKFEGDRGELMVTKDNRAISINGVTQWLAFPVVDQGGVYFLSRLDLGKTIEPAFRPQMIGEFPPVQTVVLDAGHGGRDNGALGPYESEKNFALDVARRVRDELKKAGVRVVMTRNSDVFVELADRAAVANKIPNSIFVSIHFNAADWNRSATGFEIFCVTPRGAPSTAYENVLVRDMIKESGNEHDLHSFALANAIFHSMHGKLAMFDRGVKRSRFAVLRLTRVPSVLIEGGFLTNADDARKVASKSWREDYAVSITRGIREYMKLATAGTPPRQVADYRSGKERPASMVAAPAVTPVPDVMLREMPETKAN